MNRNAIITATMVELVLAVVAVQVMATFTDNVPRWLEITAQIGGVAIICAYMVYLSITKTGGRRR